MPSLWPQRQIQAYRSSLPRISVSQIGFSSSVARSSCQYSLACLSVSNHSFNSRLAKLAPPSRSQYCDYTEHFYPEVQFAHLRGGFRQSRFSARQASTVPPFSFFSMGALGISRTSCWRIGVGRIQRKFTSTRSSAAQFTPAVDRAGVSKLLLSTSHRRNDCVFSRCCTRADGPVHLHQQQNALHSVRQYRRKRVPYSFGVAPPSPRGLPAVCVATSANFGQPRRLGRTYRYSFVMHVVLGLVGKFS